MNRTSRAAGAAVLLLALGVAHAAAHPHVFIENVTTFQFSGGKIAAIRLHWTFDELFGAGIIQEFDKNKDGKFDAAELAALQKGAFDNLREYGYFAFLTVDGADVPTRRVTGFAATIEGGRLVYQFTVPLDRAVDPRKSKLALGIYDPSYFVDVEIDGRDAVRYENNDGIACRTATRENMAKTIYDGQVNPVEMHLTCEGAP